ncbi:transcription factor SOX-6 [Ischnura elegans]|uniref:transcription factor SOX-6 n=1 Tax=Ischnura elegans TaxID=197161 RepID=UPI001ED885E0|nr:transcription factor SOX-6 [Ischnura elegans]
MCIVTSGKRHKSSCLDTIFSNVMSDETEDEIDDVEVDPYCRKFHILLERCTAMQQDNERLVNRIQRVRKMLRRARKERKFLMARLDKHGDSWRNVPLSLHLAEEPPVLIPQTHKNPEPNKLSPQVKASSSTSSTVNSEKTPRGKGGTGGGTPSSSKRKNKDGKDRDPSAPKRPANPYFQFCQEQRPLVSEQYTNIGSGQEADLSKQELTKLLASRWNSLTNDDKKVYYDKYEKQKEKYSADMQMYSSRPKFSHFPADDSSS